MSNVNRYLAPTADEVAKIRDDALRLRTCGLTGHSALFHGHTESLVMLLDLYQSAIAFLGNERQSRCPGCQQSRGTAHGADCWLPEVVGECVAAQTSADGNG